MKKLILILITILALPSLIFAAACTNGTMVKSTPVRTTANMEVIRIVATSDASGDISGTASCDINLSDAGYIYKVEVLPSATAAPTALYDCRLNTSLGNDIMQGELQNLPASNSVTEGMYTPLIGGSAMASYGYTSVALVCANMGNTKTTTFDLFIYKHD